MSDYCCGVKQANKQCVWRCNGSIQTFLCVREAPARFSVWLTQQREPVFDKQPRCQARPEAAREARDTLNPPEAGCPARRHDTDVDNIFRVFICFLIQISWIIFFTLSVCNALSPQGYSVGRNKLKDGKRKWPARSTGRYSVRYFQMMKTCQETVLASARDVVQWYLK